MFEDYTFDYDDTFSLDENLQAFVEEIEAGVNNEEIPVEEYRNRFEESTKRLKEKHTKELTETKESLKAEMDAKIAEAKAEERASIMEDLKGDVVELNEMVDKYVSTQLDEQKEEIYQDVREDLEEIDEALYNTLKEDLAELDEGIETYLKDDKIVTGEEDGGEFIVNDENEVVDKVEEDTRPDIIPFDSSVQYDNEEDKKKAMLDWMFGNDPYNLLGDGATLNGEKIEAWTLDKVDKVDNVDEACENPVKEGEDFDAVMNTKNVDVDDVRDALTDLEGDVESLKSEDFEAEDFLTDMGMEDFGMEDFGFDEDFGMFDLEDGDKNFLIENVKLGKIKSKDQLKNIVESMVKERYEKDITFKMKKVFESKEQKEQDRAIAENLEIEAKKKQLKEEKTEAGVELSEHDLFMNHFVDKKFMN